jgi:hypothetical protein
LGFATGGATGGAIGGAIGATFTLEGFFIIINPTTASIKIEHDISTHTRHEIPPFSDAGVGTTAIGVGAGALGVGAGALGVGAGAAGVGASSIVNFVADARFGVTSGQSYESSYK